MNESEKYLFDLNGYLVVKNLLSAQEAAACLAAADSMQEHLEKNIDVGPLHLGHSSIRYRFDEKYQCHCYKNQMGGGAQYIIDDFLNASPAFDALVNHRATMAYVEELIPSPFRMASSELRFRHKLNTTHTHMGGPVDVRNRYEFAGREMDDPGRRKKVTRDFNLLFVRVLYALHDIPVENGPLCVVPGSHKSNYFSPFDPREPTKEPGMIPLPIDAGDAIIFTENLRHGGYPNLIDAARKTLHLAYSPAWIATMSAVHWDGQPYVSPEAWARYDAQQRELLPQPADASELEVQRLGNENMRLKEELRRLEQPPAPAPAPSSFLARLLKS